MSKKNNPVADEPQIKVGDKYQSHYRDIYTVNDVYGGPGTPLPRIIHLELTGKGIALNARRPQQFIAITEAQLAEHFNTYEPAGK